MDLDWKQFIESEAKKEYFVILNKKLEAEYKDFTVYPKREQIFNAFELTSTNDIKCVIIGQDPYFNKGEAHGLSFSVEKGTKIPPSLRNIYKEMAEDVNVFRTSGDLSDLAKQGVLLLNRVLTVREGEPHSHKNIGWLEFTINVIKFISSLPKPIVFILWGSEAIKLKNIIDERHLIIESPHPSPLSSYRGFFGSKPFSKCNDFLIHNNRTSIIWGINGK